MRTHCSNFKNNGQGKQIVDFLHVLKITFDNGLTESTKYQMSIAVTFWISADIFKVLHDTYICTLTIFRI
jgi:hypothetical protein